MLTELAHEIGNKYFAKIPMNSTLADSPERWFNYLAKLKFEVLTDAEFWLNYWSDNPCNTASTEQDKERLKKSSESALNDFHFCLCTSLKMLIENDMENLESTLNLHEWHLIVKQEMINRGFEGMTEADSFYVDINKKNKGQLISLDEARKEGICPYCNSKEHVISYGDKWKCTVCNKYFRKA
jgi:hypothetical protein